MGGRCSTVTALLGGKLNLKPRVEVKGGKMAAGKKYRGTQDKVILKYVQDMRESLLEAFLGIRNFDALTGRISMLPDGNAAAGVIIKKIVDADGKPEAVLDELVTVPHLNE